MGNALLVRGIQRIAYLHRVLQGLIEWQRPLERRALDVFHHQVVGSNVEQRTNVGMIQRGDGSDFAIKALIKTLPRDLNSNVAARAWVVSAVHLTHPALADQ